MKGLIAEVMIMVSEQPQKSLLKRVDFVCPAELRRMRHKVELTQAYLGHSGDREHIMKKE